MKPEDNRAIVGTRTAFATLSRLFAAATTGQKLE